MRHIRFLTEGSCGMQRPCVGHPQYTIEPQLQVDYFTVVRFPDTKVRPAFRFPSRSIGWFLESQKVRRGIGSDGEEMVMVQGPSDELLDRGIEDPLVTRSWFDTDATLLRDVHRGYI